MEVIAVMIPIVALVGAFVMTVYLRRYENAERMAMIEKGVDPSLFTARKRPRTTSGVLRASLLLIGIGFGFLGGLIWDEVISSRFGYGPLPYFTMIFIFGGLGLLIAYFIEEKKNKKEEKEKRQMSE
ncbi:MAG: hypothetical protein KF845_06855 [Cyclobacteriaceae bacterium]|nr:hypothetical protein [Cyclobacteriaceae bacterium]